MRNDERHLEDLLRRLPEEIHFPPTPDIAARIDDLLPERRTSRLRHPIEWSLAAAAIALIIVIAVLPGPRDALADLLGLPGIRIEVVDRESDKPSVPTDIGSSLLFGEQSTLNHAQEIVPFAIEVPGRDGLREPDEIYLRSTDDVTMVSLIYIADGALPEIGETGVGVLLMEVQSAEGAPFLAKRAMGDGSLEIVYIDGIQEAFWVENGELVLQPNDPLLVVPDPQYERRSGNVLIWSDGRTTFRLETMLDQDAALSLAVSLVPWRSLENGNRSGVEDVGRVTAPLRSEFDVRKG